MDFIGIRGLVRIGPELTSGQLHGAQSNGHICLAASGHSEATPKVGKSSLYKHLV